MVIMEMNYSKYIRTKNSVVDDILYLNPSINPQSTSNRFVFLKNVDLYPNMKRFSDKFLDYDVLKFSGPQAIYVQRKVDICTSAKYLASNQWKSATVATTYSPDVEKPIYNDIKIQNFYLDNSLYFDIQNFKRFKLDSKEIYTEFHRDNSASSRNKKFVYTYIGDGWFYHMNKGNVTQYLRSREYGTNSFATATSLLLRILIFFFFHNFMYIGGSTGSYSSYLSQSERIDMLMSNCHEHDVRFRYRYFSPKNNVSILAFKQGDRLIAKEINGYKFGRIAEKAKTFEDLLNPYPEGFDFSWFILTKILCQVLLLLLFILTIPNGRKRSFLIFVIGSLVLTIRTVIWRRMRFLPISGTFLLLSIILFFVFDSRL